MHARQSSPLEQLSFALSMFERADDNKPRAVKSDWARLAVSLSNHREWDAKDGKLFSPASYFPGTTRSTANVDSVCLLCLDHDDGEPIEDIEARLEGLAYAIYSTYSYTPENNKCRVVIPLARPVAGTDWDRVWRKCADKFGGKMDLACKDAARMYYLPSCVPGAKRFAKIGVGEPLDEKDISDLPPPPVYAKRGEGAQQGRVGDDFNAGGSWSEMFSRLAWRLVYTRCGGREFFKREGSKNPHGAATFPDDGSLYLYSSSIPGLYPGRYDKFGFYAHAFHGGDFAAATKQLAKEGYGDPMPSLASPSISQSDIPPSNGTPADPPAPPEVKMYNRTDLGNAERLASRIAGEMRYCHVWRAWLLWNGKRWVQDTTGGDAAVARAAQIVRGMYAEAAEMEDGPDRKALAKWALSCESKTRISAMVALCTAMDGIGIAPDDLDADGWLFNCRNGTIELRTGALREHRREDLITKISPASCCGPVDAEQIPTFLKFFARISPKAAVQDFLYRYLGSCLVADNQDQALAFFYGRGANGKTTLLETVAHVLGDYAVGAPPEMLTVSRSDGGPSPELARLKGSRMVTVPETEDGKRLAESLVKRLTGGEKIYARAMYKDPFEFEFMAKIVMSGNHKPAIRGDDLGIWRRIKLVPFDQTISDEERDPLMREKLKMEMDGILAWHVAGCLEWQSKGLGEAEEIVLATADYREEMDVLGAFVAECCDEEENAQAKAGDVYKAYKTWTENGGEFTMSQTKFGRKMADRGYAKTQGAKGARMYEGIRLREALGGDAWWNKD